MDKVVIANSKFIQLFTESIIRTVATRKYRLIKKEIINQELIPQLSNQIILNSMNLKNITPDLTSLPRPPPSLSNIPLPPPMLRANQSFKMPLNYVYQIPGEYGKLNQLLKEKSITIIECYGDNKELTIIKDGDKQLTKITLNAQEIKQFLELISKKSNIPLTEGVFKARVDNFEVNAVISEIIGSRFIIRKDTPYNIIKKDTPIKNQILQNGR